MNTLTRYTLVFTLAAVTANVFALDLGGAPKSRILAPAQITQIDRAGNMLAIRLTDPNLPVSSLNVGDYLLVAVADAGSAAGQSSTTISLGSSAPATQRAAVSGQEIPYPASVIMRLGGNAEKGNYQNGSIGPNKGTIGYTGTTDFRLALGFDVITAVEDMDRLIKAELSVKHDWYKTDLQQPGYEVIAVTAGDTKTIKDTLGWALYNTPGKSVGTFNPKVEGKTKTFDVTAQIKAMGLSPVKRYVWFRIEEKPDLREPSTAGFSTDPQNMILKLTFRN
jgi:hypothetical protein